MDHKPQLIEGPQVIIDASIASSESSPSLAVPRTTPSSSPPFKSSFKFLIIRGLMVFRIDWKRSGKRCSYYANINLIRWRSLGAEKQAGQLSVMMGNLAS